LPSVLTLLLVFRLLIPTGYMIVPDGDGRPGLTLCAEPAQTAVEQARQDGHGGHDGQPADPAPAGQKERPCAFAAFAAPPLPPSPPALPSRIAAFTPEDPTTIADPPRILSASPPPPARGPPASV
jgi:hypothetical protein